MKTLIVLGAISLATSLSASLEAIPDIEVEIVRELPSQDAYPTQPTRREKEVVLWRPKDSPIYCGTDPPMMTSIIK